VAQLTANPLERLLEVAADVVGKRLQRRDVHDPSLVRQSADRIGRQTLAHQIVECSQKGGQSLARSGGRRDQRVAAFTDRGPGPSLRLGRRTEPFAEPAGHGGVELFEGHLVQ
jgi:hypothetical protein